MIIVVERVGVKMYECMDCEVELVFEKNCEEQFYLSFGKLKSMEFCEVIGVCPKCKQEYRVGRDIFEKVD